jgi:hypothetical protein
MIEENIPFGDGEGMHIARIESPAAPLEYRRMKIVWMIGGRQTFL